MKRIAVSIVLNGERHIEEQFSREIDIAFDQWIFVEGATKSTFCTSWCNAIPSQYHNNGRSIDKTVLEIKSLADYYESKPDKIKLLTTEGLWDGKVTMFNKALETIREPCWLWEIDIDEYWDRQQLSAAERVLENLGGDCGAFSCDYLLTDDIIVRGEWGESPRHGYRRLWKFQPGQKFTSHEPPVLEGCDKLVPPIYLPRFKHLSYYYEEDVKFKSLWYGKHENIYKNWLDIKSGLIKLPINVKEFFGRDDLPQEWTKSIITYR